MHSRPTSNADIPADDAIIAGRFDWVTTVTRDQLADLATRSRTVAGNARTRVTPLTDLPARRFRAASVEPAPLPQPESGSSLKPWLLIAVVAALASVIAVLATWRARRQGIDDEVDVELLMDRGTMTQTPPISDDYGYDEALHSNP